MMYKSLTKRLLVILSLALFFNLNLSAEVSPDEGKALFKANCASCHNKNMKDDLTGPALGGVEDRWEDPELLKQWIRNSALVIESGDAYANKLFNDWNKSVMTAFPNLTDDQIGSLLAYINCMNDGSCGGTPPPDPNDKNGTMGATGGGSNTFLYAILLGILALLAIVLARIISNLNYLAETKAGNAATRTTLVEMLTSKGVVGFVIFALVVLMGYTTVTNAVDLNRQQGYAPEQPIKFSHATHAGIQQIDCQYCHDGARRSKHSVIPAANTCMNCHKAIKKGSQYGTAEISKIYASAGYNPNTDQYIENYEDMPMEEVKEMFAKWIGDTYVKDEGTAPDDEFIAEQWNGIVSSLTNEMKPHVGGPIPWVRIHNLPDHAYFNHAQHVTVGKLECQECHGPVEKMEVVYQYSPLSMGWCINCHRQTEVQFADNEYYKSYQKYHDELKSGKRNKVTVEEIGGLECQKCHY